MKRHEPIKSLMQGVSEDLKAYRELRELLEEQFHAALRYEAATLQNITTRIMTMVHAMEERGLQRAALVTGLLGKDATMSKVISLQKGLQREALENGWKLLEGMVREAKQLNERNCKLMMDQRGIMQRVLHGEEHIYAPE